MKFTRNISNGTRHVIADRISRRTFLVSIMQQVAQYRSIISLIDTRSARCIRSDEEKMLSKVPSLGIICDSKCLFRSQESAQTPVIPGKPYYATTGFRSWAYFTIQLSESTINYIQIVANVSSGTPFYYANVGSAPTFQNNIWKYENVSGGNITKYVWNPNIDLNTGNYSTGLLYIGVYGYTATKYSFMVNAQGPIVLQDRQVSTPTFSIPNSYVFYKFTVDNSLRSLQVVVQAPYPQILNFFVGNSTSLYPVYRGKYQYSSSNYVYQTSCLQVDYPWPGNYRLGLSTSPKYNYTIQFVENDMGTCKIEY
eukprot:TRINITY_DN1002_c0_g2_i1.p1 TRINITY_DN1002_c0_g2~~TRINITY_DN1002_c0_g2_i1.p1  ORF type:complete len:310 (+),score=9.16 TRINITY_DN1002_c0_g2_i1:858-1787(+)